MFKGVKDHITPKMILNMLLTNENDEMSLVTEYTRTLMARKENQCVKKSSLKTGYSKIHIGNNQWSHRLDKTLYPKMMATIASEFCDLVQGQSKSNQKTRQRMIDRMIPFLDYMAGEGYCNSNNREKVKTILQQFRELVRELKMIVYDTTTSQ